MITSADNRIEFKQQNVDKLLRVVCSSKHGGLYQKKRTKNKVNKIWAA